MSYASNFATPDLPRACPWGSISQSCSLGFEDVELLDDPKHLASCTYGFERARLFSPELNNSAGIS